MLVAALQMYLAFQSNFYERGMKDLEEGRYQAAVEDLTNAVAAEPKDYALHFNLALAYSFLKRDTEAIAEYKKTLDIKPGLYQAELNLGILLLRDKQPGDAIEPLSAAVKEKPKEFRPNYYLAEALLASGDFEKAEASYRAALEADPKSAPAEAGLARALLKQGHLIESKTHFEKAAELNPQYRDSTLELAEAFEAHGEPDQAIPIYQQFPDNPAAKERVGALLIKEGKAADAVKELEAVVTQSPTVANKAALATAYLRNKQRDKAFPLVEQLLQSQPDDFELRMLYGRMLRDDRKFPDAAQQFYTATKLKPDSPEAWSEFAGVLVMAENYPAALTALDHIAALHAEKPGHVYLRAIVLDKIKQIKPALESYQRFLSLSNGQNPDEEFKARQRARILQKELSKR
jgi:tetratricopeptide (TPR) repeat protein